SKDQRRDRQRHTCAGGRSAHRPHSDQHHPSDHRLLPGAAASARELRALAPAGRGRARDRPGAPRPGHGDESDDRHADPTGRAAAVRRRGDRKHPARTRYPRGVPVPPLVIHGPDHRNPVPGHRSLAAGASLIRGTVSMSEGPLAGLRVVDLTRVLAGPFCTMLLADLGAEVIKVETPPAGDPIRVQGGMRDGFSWYFAGFNRNKRSIALNLRTTEGMNILKDLLKSADVLVENFRPTVLDDMGLTEEVLRKLNADLVVCSISGYGKTGPYRN